MNKSERNYAQIEKETLSIIFGIKKFHQYLYGRKFLLVTDHKPLVTLLGSKSGIPTLAAEMGNLVVGISVRDRVSFNSETRESRLFKPIAVALWKQIRGIR